MEKPLQGLGLGRKVYRNHPSKIILAKALEYLNRKPDPKP